MATDWNTPRQTDRCAGCERAFSPGEPLRAFLYETPAGYERRDYCEQCSPTPAPQPVGAWRTRRPVPTARRRTTFDPAAAWELFQQLEDAAEPGQIQLRFLLALLLWRKRILKLEGTADGPTGETWTFRDPQTDTVYPVLRPDLVEDELEALGAQLEQLVCGELRPADLLVTDQKPEPEHE